MFNDNFKAIKTLSKFYFAIKNFTMVYSANVIQDGRIMFLNVVKLKSYTQ